ncbi:MAG: tRNA (adenosine(37)-N6)-dimethylallyltransferase MiaA [Verrucomicrobiota bacterium]
MNSQLTKFPRPLFITGPTACGKSQIALDLAERLNGEIISVDSMQVYRGLDIGTAKPALAERKMVPHHLIDVVDLDEAFDAAKFCRLAASAVAEIQGRVRVPIFCGGTGFYFKAFLEGLGESPPANATLRAELEQISIAKLLNELQERDPLTFEKIDRQNPRRVIRAVEVIRLTGKPFSEQRAEWKRQRSSEVQMCFGMARSRTELHFRIENRVDEMFKHGLVAETEVLLHRGLEENQTAMQAIGYRQAVEYLRGKRSLAETIELVKIRTRQFSKRQLTWFRRQMQLNWIHLGDAQEIDAAVKIEKAFHEICVEEKQA